MPSSDINQVRELVKLAPGWLHDWEGQLLYRLAKNCAGRGVIVEIGSFCGKSTVWLGRGSKAAGKGVKIYAIDPHPPDLRRKSEGAASDTFRILTESIQRAGIGDLTQTVVQTADAAAPGFDHPIELIFIDGDHEYDGVISDCRNWYPKVVEGGIMAFHDCRDFPGVRRAMLEFVYASNRFRKIRVVRSILYAVKAENNTRLDRVLNRLTLIWHDFLAALQRLAYGTLITLRLVKPTKDPR